MEIRRLMDIIERLMELNCSVLYIDGKYVFIYKNYVIRLNEYNIWLGDDCYSYENLRIGGDFCLRVKKYYKRSIDLDKLERVVNCDIRKQKLDKINVDTYKE